jgi:hypothetical protein
LELRRQEWRLLDVGKWARGASLAVNAIADRAGHGGRIDGRVEAGVPYDTRKAETMRTAMIIAGGFVLWGICIGIAKYLAGMSAAATTTATAIFLAAWFCAAAFNMWMGVAKTGYSFREELPVFLVIFLLPAIVAMVAKWKFF